VAGLATLLSLAGCDIDRSLLYFPDRSRPELRAVGIPAAQEATLATADGLQLLAWWVPPQGARPAIAYFHGNGGHIGYRAERLRRFAQEGLGVLFVEYRGYGGNPGSPSEEGLYADGRAALDFLERAGVAPDRIVLYGESLGGAVAVRLASERPVAAVILESPFTSIEAVGRHHYPFLPVRQVLRDRFDNAARIGAVRAPILFLHGERDQVVPIAFGRALFAAAPEPKEAWTTPEGGHNDLREHGALDVALDFLRRRVSPRPGFSD
jgi:fermentation-respiration switch protein FrsA (DUF1100 family)